MMRKSMLVVAVSLDTRAARWIRQVNKVEVRQLP